MTHPSKHALPYGAVEPAPSALRGGLTSAAITLALMLPVAFAVADHGWLFATAAFGVSCLAVAALCIALPHGSLFALGVVTGIAVYICLYVVIGRSAFPAILWWADPVAFAMPVLSFAALCVLRRREFPAPGPAELDGVADMAHLSRFGRWLTWCAALGILCLGLPLNRLSPEGQTAALLTAMAVLSAISLRSMRDVVRLLADVAGILANVAARMRFLAAPMVTYTLLFSLLAVAFGCFYRIADGLSQRPLFQKFGQTARLDFSETLHFSIVTLATVGYGDILPIDDGVRLLATIQMIIGQLLLLFGFAEIMREKLKE